MRCSCLALALCLVVPACSRQHGEGQTQNASDAARASRAQATHEASAGGPSVAADAWDEPEEELEPVEVPAPRDEAETASMGGPIEQGTSERDRRLTQEIRRALIEDDKLSFTAKNARIITRDGNVTLRGQVISSQERKRIEEIARKYAADGSIDNQLELKNSATTPSDFELR